MAEERDTMADHQAVRDALQTLRVALGVAAQKKGEKLCGLAVLWVTENAESLFDGGVTAVEGGDHDMMLAIMSNFLQSIMFGDRTEDDGFEVQSSVN
jgi:hypothetical protein